MTRAALTAQGDNYGVSIAFRDVFSPLLNTRTQNRTNPTWNITDDLTWVKNSHTVQFGANIRVIRNNFANAGGRAAAGTFDAVRAALLVLKMK